MASTFRQAFIRGYYLGKVAQAQTAGDSWRPSVNRYGNIPLRNMFSSNTGSNVEFTLPPESLKGIQETYAAIKANLPKTNPTDTPAGPLKPG